MNKWLGLQAGAALPNNVENVKRLTEHPAFDIKNPNKVYSLVGGFTRWRKYDEKRQGMMQAQLERIVGTEGLSENVFEIVSKSLE